VRVESRRGLGRGAAPAQMWLFSSLGQPDDPTPLHPYFRREVDRELGGIRGSLRLDEHQHLLRTAPALALGAAAADGNGDRFAQLQQIQQRLLAGVSTSSGAPDPDADAAAAAAAATGTYADLRPGRPWVMPGLEEGDPDGESKRRVLLQLQRAHGYRPEDGAAERLGRAYAAYGQPRGGDPGDAGDLGGGAEEFLAYPQGGTGGAGGRGLFDSTEALRRHSGEYTSLLRQGISHADGVRDHREARHAEVKARAERQMNASASADGDERRAERLRRVHASSSAATFHAKLAAAQKNVREPLGRTRALHHGAEGDAADHCWQPARREEPASDAGTLDDELRRRLGVG